MRGQQDPRGGHQGRLAAVGLHRGLFEQVEGAGATQDSEVHREALGVGDGAEHRPGEPFQRFVRAVGRGEAICRGTERAAAGLRQVQSESLVHEAGEDVVRGRPRQVEVTCDGRSSDGPGVLRQVRQDV